ncbi:MAG TPA: 3-oxoadipate enol-lactonase [Acidimicrobiales bacterium]|nr:3-oxoadipate enol-lactonase [Acidimicrobiales bacterium]
MIPPHRIDGPDGAPAVVLSNSLGTTWRMWDPQLPTLTQRFRVVRYEHRGHGGTAPPAPGPYRIADLGGDVIELLDHLGVERASICGLSLGGMVALWLAAHHPQRVERLVLACTAAELGPPEGWTERAATVRADSPAAMAPALLWRWFTPGFVGRRPDVAELVTEMLGSAAAEGYAGCCEAIGAMDQRPDLGSVVAPTLVIAGAQDPVTPPARCLELQAGVPGAALVVLPGAAHLANIEQAAAFDEALVGHLAGTSLQRGDAMRRRVLGDAHVDRSAATATPMTAPFSEFITRTAWGDVWTRPQLDLRTRSCITVAVLAALGRHDELRLHLTGARRNGLSDEEIAEVILHTAVYAGVPAANAALAIAREVLAQG